MKKLILIISTLLFSIIGNAQDLPDFSSYKLEKKEDFTERTNKAALAAANYVLDSPVDKSDPNRANCLMFIVRWMNGSPDYSFVLGDDKAMKIAGSNSDVGALFFAALTKYALEQKSIANDDKKLKLGAVKLILEYIQIKENNIKLNKELKKAIDANAIGELESYLN